MGELSGHFVVWGDFDFEGLDDAAGGARAVGDGGEVSGLEGLGAFVLPFPERGTGRGFGASKDEGEELVGHLGGVTEVIGVDGLGLDIWVALRVGLLEAGDELSDLLGVGGDHGENVLGEHSAVCIGFVCDGDDDAAGFVADVYIGVGLLDLIKRVGAVDRWFEGT